MRTHTHSIHTAYTRTHAAFPRTQARASKTPMLERVKGMFSRSPKRAAKAKPEADRVTGLHTSVACCVPTNVMLAVRSQTSHI